MPEEQEQKQETVREACDRLRDAARNIMTIVADFTNDPRRVLCDLADRIEAAVKWEHRQLRSLVGRFANCHEDNEDFGALLREARFVLADTPYAVADGEPVAVPHGRVAEKAGAESRPFVGVDLAKGRPTYTCVEIASGNAAAMRAALESAHRTLKLVCKHAGEFVQPRLAEEVIHTGAAVERALAAPARNCDRFATYEEAVKAYRAWTEQNTGNVSNASGRGMLGWPFAPAEGDAE